MNLNESVISPCVRMACVSPCVCFRIPCLSFGLIAKKPYFIYWPRHAREWSNWPASSLNYLAEALDGKVAFRYGDYYVDENFRMTFEIYEPGKSFYIDEEGKAYIYPGMPSLNATKAWIDERKFRMSPF